MYFWWTRSGTDIDAGPLGTPYSSNGADPLNITGDYQGSSHATNYTLHVSDRYDEVSATRTVTVNPYVQPTLSGVSVSQGATRSR